MTVKQKSMLRASYFLKAILLGIVICVSPKVDAQDQLQDLDLEQYILMVAEGHPIAIQSELLQRVAASNRKMARGGFDPKLEGSWDQKSFDDKNYYSLSSGMVKLPTWYGVEVKAGYNRNQGVFLDNSDNLPAQGLWSAGISVPLGKGLLLDKRRADLKKADIFTEATIEEQTLLINELLFEATQHFLAWQYATASLAIAKEGIQLAEIRLAGTRSSFVNGDKPAIDTLESLISLQNRILDSQKASLAVTTTLLQVNNLLWVDGTTPIELQEGVSPSKIDFLAFDTEINTLRLEQSSLVQNHPEVVLLSLKNDQLTIDQKLAYEDLKPDLRIQYNPLLTASGDSPSDNFNINDYKLGVSLTYPIIQRKQRGKLQLTKIKIEQNELKQLTKSQQIQLKLDTYLNEIDQISAQLTTLTATVDMYNRMLRAENRKFLFGESSIFLINSREAKYLDARYKLLDLTNKLIKSRAKYINTAAQMQVLINDQ